ncbi:acyltransferase [Vibrio sp. Vb1018]|uniref:acyltransferase n=1 Tax=Vibrio sp. Vb1018 TaxID=3074636 RepID=UPI002964D1BA|nr:acyltransferase [Vibrio sp. Vb1018]MDW1821128.1 acyltransferase [Vibrio sp. Vb1018]
MNFVFLILNKFIRLISMYFSTFLGYLKFILSGCKIRGRCIFYGSAKLGSSGVGITISHKCSFGDGFFISASKGANIKIGHNVSVNTGCHLVAVKYIEIGENTAIGEFVSIRDQNHRFCDTQRGISSQGYDSSPVSIGRNVWIGRGCYIGAGVKIGDFSVVGANSVVTKDIPSNVVVAGNPARVIRHIR